jgi:transcriptional regulator with XRE-family HTH domain
VGSAKKVSGLDVDKLGDYLREHGIQPSVLSVNMGASPSYISRILSGGNVMSQMAYTSMCHCLNVSETEFIKKKPSELSLDEVYLKRIEEKLDVILRRLGC